MQRVAIVGFGFMGKTHYAAWKRLRGARVVAVCDSNLAQLTARTVGNIATGSDKVTLPRTVKVHSDFEAMLAAGGFDIVDITLPTPLHPAMTIRALATGYHVLCEKPMALSVADCDRMLAAAKKAHRRLLVAHCVRFMPAYAYLRDVIRDGRYGRVLAADFTRFASAPGWNNGGKSWFLDEAKSGGVGFDLHVHDTDFIAGLFGVPRQVRSFAQFADGGGIRHLSTVYDYDGMLVTSDASWNCARTLPFDAAYRVFLEKATIFCGDRYQASLTVYPNDGKPFTPRLPKRSGYEAEIGYFLDMVEGRIVGEELMTAKSGRDSIALLEAELRSARTGRACAFGKRGQRSEG